MPDSNSDLNAMLQFYFNVKKESESWSDFMVLHLRFEEDLSGLHTSACLIIESYLRTIPYRAYTASEKDMYFIFQNRDTQFFARAVQDIITFCHAENVFCIDNWYAMNKQLPEFLRHIEKQWLEKKAIVPAHMSNDKPQKAKYMTGTVMLVEDDPVTRWMVRHALKPKCFLITATCAGHVYNLYSACRPDVVFLDIGLPDGSGETVLKWILSHDPSANIVMFSGQNDVDTMMRSFEDGAKGFIAKPYNPDKIKHYLDIFSIPKPEVQYV